MQRSKIKVGVEYALAAWRDWDKYRGHAKKVQVLDVGAWEDVPHYRAQIDTAAPETVPVPGYVTDQVPEMLEVSKRYRRRVPTKYDRGLGSLVLIRQWLPGENGNEGAWGEPTTAQTRHLVATWEDAEAKMQAYQDEQDAQTRAARAEKSRRNDREGRINERLRDLGVNRSLLLERSRFSGEDVSTVTADLLEALLTLAEGRS